MQASAGQISWGGRGAKSALMPKGGDGSLSDRGVWGFGWMGGRRGGGQLTRGGCESPIFRILPGLGSGSSSSPRGDVLFCVPAFVLGAD
jgi:hypothetical protein